jgi:hypothetical protein
MKIICIFTFIFTFLLTGPAFPIDPEHLKRKAFSDPSYEVQMPEKWKEKKIEYESWAKDADLALTIGQHLYPAVLPIINKYAKDNGLSIALKKGVCGITAGRLARKSIDIGSFCCPPGPDDRLPGLKFFTLGISPLALVVNSNNPVKNISLDQAQRVFEGKIQRWSELKGPDSQIQPIARLHCKMRPGMWRLMLPSEELFGTMVNEVATINDVIVSVADDRNAIGFESLWQINNHDRSRDIKVLGINGSNPVKTSDLLSGNYPIYQTYTVAFWEGKGVENSHARALVKYIMKELENDKIKSSFYLVTAPSLKKAGWKFNNYELSGEKEK